MFKEKLPLYRGSFSLSITGKGKEAVRFLKVSNIKKTVYYCKRNGIRKTIYAALERILYKERNYSIQKPDREVLERQKNKNFSYPYKFSILVPVYETKEEYLKELIESVLSQTYQEFELIIADASKGGKVEETVRAYPQEHIVYRHLEKNGGISENTNRALEVAAGDYIGLLDHDDILAPDALFEMAKAVERKKKAGGEAEILYSDEDKCNSRGNEFFEPHKKTGFNLDLLLSNNYICHFLVMKAELMKGLGFRKPYDGAQDYDIVLRAVGALLKKDGYERTVTEKICHVPRILYHWRCHEESTAANPQSKQYAYEAGKRAIEDFLENMGWKARVRHTDHVGFYRLGAEDLFETCGDVAAVGGSVVGKKNKIKAGIYKRDGSAAYGGMNFHFSGYMHRAAMQQTAYALDLRCMKVKREFFALFEEITGMKYEEDAKTGMFLWKKYKKSEEEWKDLSMAFCRKAAGNGYRLIFVPDLVCRDVLSR